MKGILFVSMLIFLSGCREKNLNEVLPAFYHWKTNVDLTQYEKNVLQQNNIQETYIRFFDVAWDATYSKPVPVAQVRFTDTSFNKTGISIIPTVFITNECIQYIRPEQCKPLAENIYTFITDILLANGIDSVNEIQIDCDWTTSTKEKYFSILSALQEIDPSHLYSATIRLFQVKYAPEAGVPPVKKGLLMCYNMGNLKSPGTKNSILDPDEVKKYTGSLGQYSLPLDVALPLFRWSVLFRKGAYAGLVQNISKQEIASLAKEISPNRFKIIADTIYRNVSLKKEDILRVEECSYDDIIQTASVLKEKLNGHKRRLILYHLDSLTLSKYAEHEIKSIFHSLD